MNNENERDAFPWDPPRKDARANNVGLMPVGRFKQEYNMRHKKRGYAYIFNNEYTNEIYKLQPQEFQNDCETLFNTLENLGFEVSYHKNYTVDQIHYKLGELAAMNHNDCDCVLVAVLSLGNDGILYASDKFYNLDSIYNQFSAESIISLAGKPKIFIIEASRGTKLDTGVTMQNQNYTETDNLKDDSTSFKCVFKIPVFADFLIVHSTPPGFHSFFNRTMGSFFIRSLCNEFNENANKYSILILLTFVCQKVAYDFGTRKYKNSEFHIKQIPCITSTLTRLLNFN